MEANKNPIKLLYFDKNKVKIKLEIKQEMHSIKKFYQENKLNFKYEKFFAFIDTNYFYREDNPIYIKIYNDESFNNNVHTLEILKKIQNFSEENILFTEEFKYNLFPQVRQGDSFFPIRAINIATNEEIIYNSTFSENLLIINWRFWRDVLLNTRILATFSKTGKF